MRDQQNPSTPDLHQPLLFAASELLACGTRITIHSSVSARRTAAASLKFVRVCQRIRVRRCTLLLMRNAAGSEPGALRARDQQLGTDRRCGERVVWGRGRNPT